MLKYRHINKGLLNMKDYFKDLIFYEIYPTSFYDSNGDGIGDLNGIKEKLDYVKDLGFNAIWLNPFYKSPFKDGGYDVSDFFDVDPRFGTLKDFDAMIKRAHDLGIKVIIDLVAGHASNENQVFLKSAEPQRNEYSDLFIWTDSAWAVSRDIDIIRGVYDRDSGYAVNFFAIQPAFNYGFNEINAPWQMSYKDERTFLARNYLLDIMRFWLKRGADGFRVDMASSLVKNDDWREKTATIEVWHYLFGKIRKEFPDSIFVSEWGYIPSLPFKAGFDGDFILNSGDNIYTRMVFYDDRFFDGFEVDRALEVLKRDLDYAKEYNSFISLISGNHDTVRIAGKLNDKELRSFYMFLLSMPGMPFIYAGDEIGMKTSNLTSKDGGYSRTGSRTPMQWNKSRNGGFSSTKGELYLPTMLANKNNVEDSLKDEKSLLNYIKKLISIRKQYDDLRNNEVEINNDNGLVSIKRNKLVLYMNISDRVIPLDESKVIIHSGDNKKELSNKESVLMLL